MDADLNIAANMSLSLLSRPFTMYGGLWFFFMKTSFADLVYSQGEHDQLSRAKYSACSQG